MGYRHRIKGGGEKERGKNMCRKKYYLLASIIFMACIYGCAIGSQAIVEKKISEGVHYSTERIALPSLDKPFPLKIYSQSWLELEKVDFLSGFEHEIITLKNSFQNRGTYPIGKLQMNINAKDDFGHKLGLIDTAVWTSKYTCSLMLTVPNWEDKSEILLEHLAKGYCTVDYRSTGFLVDPGNQKQRSDEGRLRAFNNAVVDLLNKTENQRNDLEKLTDRYLASKKQPSQVESALSYAPSNDRFTIHVAYPKESEQIADDRVTLLGYVTSANKTESLKLFVNRKRQFVDELWRDTPINVVGLRGYPLDLSVPIEKGKNIIEIRVLDHEGFMVNHKIEVHRIEIAETRMASSISLGKRLPDLESKTQDKQVNEKNFAVVIEDWVKQTAVSDYNKGNRMYDDGRLERAAYYYRKAVRTDPLAPAFFNLGLTLKGLGNESEARQAFEKACEQKEERACEMISL